MSDIMSIVMAVLAVAVAMLRVLVVASAVVKRNKEARVLFRMVDPNSIDTSTKLNSY